MPRRPLVAGNWKMNGFIASLAEVAAMATAYDAALKRKVELIICPPATLIGLALEVATQGGVGLGAQDCHLSESGAHTGDISAKMLKDVGASYVIVGHSERRAEHGETDRIVQAKAAAALCAGLTPIVCVGETRAEREAGAALSIVGRQIEGSLPADAPGTIVVAYEPVWAIGTGLTPTPADVAEMHKFAREQIEARLGGGKSESIRILYGGSVKPANAPELMAVENVDGALVGGASLKAIDFMAIAEAYR
ncbi:triose-phosphate isomerase [Methylocystis sp. JAN1]|uniref:triose-phosphate isomerase n=1 Tax=Methylocystis sp. JAN1 TaxID=3397211 RepID=UPI003FA32AE3